MKKDYLEKYTGNLLAIISHYGKDNQKIKAIEELSELQKELCKSFIIDNDKKIAEEMADCYMMLEQLSIIYNNDNDIENIIRQKIERTLNNIKEEMRTKE